MFWNFLHSNSFINYQLSIMKRGCAKKHDGFKGETCLWLYNKKSSRYSCFTISIAKKEKKFI